MPGLNKTAFIFEKDYIIAASLTPDGTKALTLNSDNGIEDLGYPEWKKR